MLIVPAVKLYCPEMLSVSWTLIVPPVWLICVVFILCGGAWEVWVCNV